MKRFLVPALMVTALAVGAVLAVSLTQGSDELPTCGQLQEVVVSLDRPEAVDARKCKDPITGEVMWEVLEGRIIDEGDNPPPSLKPTEEVPR